MMKDLYIFLEKLRVNNNKTWMDEHRAEYNQVRDAYILWLDDLDARLAEIDPSYDHTEGKRAIHRINNNLMFHPDRPTYKEHIGATMDRVKEKSDFYIHIGPEESFVAGGYYHPPSSILSKIREAIDYDGDVLQSILDEKRFKANFVLEQDLLKTSPKGFTQDHPHIKLLRYKSFAVMHTVTRQEVCHPDFQDKVVELYKVMMPFRDYLNRAVLY
ncbi:DUF2461 domain-containing protein [Fulvivirga sedimenti]|uniref:DUF2461 domain-containing protein n=1 Tax=Fulvivirga sedimenti TaxID=2879465 RepID=A0A9X1HW18_9BACT|nr:DUF2461 domain-containing protein [Fulvivirga sedimenti]MCA6075512.1 DUF2461 domain-containing protein [Fulvivirga sedimenti]MCA6076689.1 DUF2461 domain-containing protein [Fulvivirga sedimenti]MCA6077817.1 DUF2461 domain-containing protein [Fulvivirga sedimenti]